MLLNPNNNFLHKIKLLELSLFQLQYLILCIIYQLHIISIHQDILMLQFFQYHIFLLLQDIIRKLNLINYMQVSKSMVLDFNQMMYLRLQLHKWLLTSSIQLNIMQKWQNQYIFMHPLHTLDNYYFHYNIQMMYKEFDMQLLMMNKLNIMLRLCKILCYMIMELDQKYMLFKLVRFTRKLHQRIQCKLLNLNYWICLKSNLIYMIQQKMELQQLMFINYKITIHHRIDYMNQQLFNLN